MAQTMRFPESLKAAAAAYAAAHGISLNALVRLALVDYLQARGVGLRARGARVEVERSEAPPSPLGPAAITPAVMAVAQQQSAQRLKSVPRQGRNEPCSCGSGQKYKHCHGARA